MPLADVNGTSLFYQVTGAGEPIVLIPGLGTTHAFFNGAVPALAARYQVIGLDLRGVGQSAKPKQRYSMELWADDIAALLQHLGIQRAHILGSSLGGCVAQVFADRYPDRTQTLLLAATFSEIDYLLELNYRVRIALIGKLGMGELLADYAATALFGRTFLQTPQGRAAAANTINVIRANDPEIYVEHLMAVLRFGCCEPGQENEPKFTERLRRLTMPTLITVGDEDVLTVPRFSRIMAETLPNAKLVIQPGAGHVTIVEQPAESARLVLDFLASC